MTQTVSYPILLGRPPLPNEGSRYIPVSFDIAHSTHDTSITKVVNASDSGMATMQSIEIDNSDNGGPINVRVVETDQLIFVPSYSIVVSPIYAQGLSVTLQVRWQWAQWPFPYEPPLNIRLFNFPQIYSRRTSLDLDTVYGVNWRAPICLAVAVPSAAWTMVLPGSYRSRLEISYDPSAPAGELWFIGYSGSSGTDMPTIGFPRTGANVCEAQVGDNLSTHTSIWVRQSSGVARTLSVAWWNV